MMTEKLLGKGDMLFLPTDAAKPRRLQGCYLSDEEIEKMVYFWNSQQGPSAPIKVQEFSLDEIYMKYFHEGQPA